jgi:hypothetical protein
VDPNPFTDYYDDVQTDFLQRGVRISFAIVQPSHLNHAKAVHHSGLAARTIGLPPMEYLLA